MKRARVLLSLAVIGWGIPATGFAAMTHNRLATNRLATNRLATNRLATNRLATNRLSTNNLDASGESAELLSTPEGRELYYYIMTCALPPETAIRAQVPGAPDSSPDSPEPSTNTPYTCVSETCTFPGGLGLAPKWIDHKLNKKGQRWISACLFARVNAYDTAEAISLRGNQDSLTASTGEREEFPLEEGAFYGQVFTEVDEPFVAYACMGRAQADGDTGGLALRDCTEPDPADPSKTRCGFINVGPCRDFDPVTPDPYACQSFDDGYNGKCHDAPGAGKWPKSRKYKEVITVFVSN